MKNAYIFIYLFVFTFPMVMISSCSSSDDQEVIIQKETVIIVDTLFKNQVSVETINKKFVVQLAAFKEKAHSDSFVQLVKDKLNANPDVRKKGDIYVITVGNFNYSSSANDYLNLVKAKGFPDAFVKALD